MPYQLLSFRTPRGPRAGVLIDGTVYDTAQLTKVPAHASVLAILEDWARARRLLDRASRPLGSGASRWPAHGSWPPSSIPAPSTAPAPTTPITWPRWRGPRARHPGRR